MSLIAKRFERNEPPYTAEEISEEHQIPIRLTNQTLYQLQEINLIHEVVTDQKSEEIAYQPSMDLNQLNVAVVLDRLAPRISKSIKKLNSVMNGGFWWNQEKNITRRQARYY